MAQVQVLAFAYASCEGVLNANARCCKASWPRWRNLAMSYVYRFDLLCFAFSPEPVTEPVGVLSFNAYTNACIAPQSH